MQKFIGEVLSEGNTKTASGFTKAINRFLTVVKQALGLNNKGLDEFVKDKTKTSTQAVYEL